MSEPETATTCVRHPGERTNIRCSSCGVAICPSCAVQTPVGLKCPRCGTNSNASLYRPSLLQYVCGTLAGLAAGAVAGWAVQFQIGTVTVLLAAVYGGFAGQMIRAAMGRKRGIRPELTAAASLVAGALGGRLAIAAAILRAPGAPRPPHGIWEAVVALWTPTPVPLIALVVIVAVAVGRMRSL